MFAMWDDIDFAQKTYKVEGKDDVNFVPKNHEVRVTPLTTEVCEMLKSARRPGEGSLDIPSRRREAGGSLPSQVQGDCKECGFELRGVQDDDDGREIPPAETGRSHL